MSTCTVYLMTLEFKFIENGTRTRETISDNCFYSLIIKAFINC